MLPPELPTWRKVNGQWADHPLFPDIYWPDQAGADHGVVRAYGAYTGSQCCVTLSGVKNRVVLTARGSWDFVAYDVLTKARTPYTFSSDELFVSRTGPFLNLIQGTIFGEDVDGTIAKAQADFSRILQRTNPK